MSDGINQGHDAVTEDQKIREFLYQFPAQLFAPKAYTLETFPRVLLPRHVDPLGVNDRQDEVPAEAVNSFLQALRNKEPYAWEKFLAHLACEIMPNWEAFDFLRSESPFASNVFITVFRCTGGSLQYGYWDVDGWLKNQEGCEPEVTTTPALTLIKVNFD